MGNLNISRSELIKWIITFVGSAIFLLIPEQGFYTMQVKLFFTITAFGLFVMAFEFWPIVVVSALMPALWIIAGVAPVNVVMAGWTGTTMYMIMGAFLLAASLQDSGLLDRVSYWMMSKVKGSYWKLLVGIYIVGIFLCIVTFGLSAYIILAPICLGLCKSLNCVGKNAGAGIATACMLGTCSGHAFTYAASSYAIIKAGSPTYLADVVISPVLCYIHQWPMFFVCLFILWLVSKWYKPEEEFGSSEFFIEKLNEMGAMTYREKANAVILILTILFVCTSGIHGLSSDLGFMIIPWLAYLPFIKAADTNTITKYLNWQMIFFAFACVSIGVIAAYLGLGNVIGQVCVTLLDGRDSAFIVMAILFVIEFLLNFLMTPMAIFGLLTEPIMAVASGLGYDLLPFVYAISASAEAIIFPYEYGPYLIVFSFGMMSMKDFIKINSVRCVIYFAGFLGLLIPYWMLIGLL